MRIKVVVALVAMALAMASMAAADSTTSQTWTFSTDANPASPEIVSNAFGSPVAVMNVTEIGSGWSDTWAVMYGSAQGVWDVGEGSIELSIPNSPNTGVDTYKEIELTVTYLLEPNQAPIINVAPTASVVSYDASLIENLAPSAWYRGVWVLRLEPNPESEKITLQADKMGLIVDDISVSTVCSSVPEPGSLCAMLSGLVGLAGMVIKRRK